MYSVSCLSACVPVCLSVGRLVGWQPGCAAFPPVAKAWSSGPRQILLNGEGQEAKRHLLFPGEIYSVAGYAFGVAQRSSCVLPGNTHVASLRVVETSLDDSRFFFGRRDVSRAIKGAPSKMDRLCLRTFTGRPCVLAICVVVKGSHQQDKFALRGAFGQGQCTEGE